MIDIKIIEEFVKNSNMIEIIYCEECPEYSNHLETALKVEEESVKNSKIIHPLHLHAMLMKDILRYPGIYRQLNMYIRGAPKEESLANYTLIDKVMQTWYESLKNDVSTMYKLRETGELDKKTIEDVSWNYHHWFECIHPFIDGNGRTGRLILNNIRRSFGLDWLIIKGTPEKSHELIKEHNDYYESIRKWRKENQKLLQYE